MRPQSHSSSRRPRIPTSPEYQHYLGAGQFASVFAASQAEITAVEQQLTADGLQVTGVSSNDLLVEFAGTAADVETAFDTGLNQVQLADGTLGQATTAAVSIPSSIAPDVQSVVGLDQLVPETNDVMKPTAGHDGATPAAATPVISNGGPVACSDALAQQRFTVHSPTSRSPRLTEAWPVCTTPATWGRVGRVHVYELEPYLTFGRGRVRPLLLQYPPLSHTSNITNFVVDGGPGTGAMVRRKPPSTLRTSGGSTPDAKSTSISRTEHGRPVRAARHLERPSPIADDARQISSSWGLCETGAAIRGRLVCSRSRTRSSSRRRPRVSRSWFAAGDDVDRRLRRPRGQRRSRRNLSLDDPAAQPYATSVEEPRSFHRPQPPGGTVWNNGNSPRGCRWGRHPEDLGTCPRGRAGPRPYSETGRPRACSDDPIGRTDNYHLAGIRPSCLAGRCAGRPQA